MSWNTKFKHHNLWSIKLKNFQSGELFNWIILVKSLSSALAIGRWRSLSTFIANWAGRTLYQNDPNDYWIRPIWNGVLIVRISMVSFRLFWNLKKDYIDVGNGCWRTNLLVTSLGCWWPNHDIGDRFNTLRKSST